MADEGPGVFEPSDLVAEQGTQPGFGSVGDQERKLYGEALMSGVDEKAIRRMESERAMGTREFAATLEMERGRYRVKRGKPSRCVRVTS